MKLLEVNIDTYENHSFLENAPVGRSSLSGDHYLVSCLWSPRLIPLGNFILALKYFCQ